MKRRLGMTEGQTYTVVILVVVAVLLSTSLTRLHGRVAELISAPGPAVTTTTQAPPTTGAPVTTPTSTGRSTMPPPTSRPTGVGTGSTTPTTTSSSPTTPPSTTPTTLGEGDDGPEAPCPAEGSVQGARKVFEQLDKLLGGILPSATLTSVVAIVSGCSETDPLVLVLATLVELGEGLPDLGLDFFEFPVLPFIELPAVVVELLQPLVPALDPICDLVGTVGLLFSQVGPSFPYPLDATFAVSLFYLTSTCGQLQKL